MAKNKPTLFADVVGQNAAKRRMTFYQQCYTKSGMMPNSMIVAQKGGGKTFMAKALGQHLMREGEAKAKPFLEINCASLKNIRQFFNNVVIPHMIDKDITILFDEASELPKDMEMGLLTILNPNKNHRNEFAVDDYVVDFDFRRHTFMFATSEPHKVFHALMDRLDRIDLEEYKNDELGEIVSRNLPDIKFENGLLTNIATVLRGNARAAQKMANNIAIFLKAKRTKKFTNKHWAELKDQLGILPLGLNPIEVQVLRHLSEKKDCSLTHLSAKTGLSKACLQRDFEMYLQKMNLMEITTAGRAITSCGQKYLEGLAE